MTLDSKLILQKFFRFWSPKHPIYGAGAASKFPRLRSKGQLETENFAEI